ncbi:MAG: folate-binding protein YgfZ [Planctomycetes bacterium]|nr:folate-binding protein YgfZ [Planctomycetota bacterium]
MNIDSSDRLSDVVDPDYVALRDAVGWCGWDRFTRYLVHGADREKFLQAYCTNDVVRLEPGQGCEAFVPNGQGKAIGFVNLFRESDRIVLETTPDQGPTLVNHLDRYLLRSDVRFEDDAPRVRRMMVAGPAAREWLSGQLPGGPLPEALPSSRGLQWRGQTLWVARLRWLLPDCYLIAVDLEHATSWFDHLRDSGIRECNAAAVECCRIESGTPWFGSDITPDNLPQELGIDDRAISFKKGCYLGQETIARIDALGHVNWMFRMFQFQSDGLPPVPFELTSQGKRVARITSTTWSPRLAAPLGLGYVRRGHHADGTTLECPEATAKVLTRIL